MTAFLPPDANQRPDYGAGYIPASSFNTVGGPPKLTADLRVPMTQLASGGERDPGKTVLIGPDRKPQWLYPDTFASIVSDVNASSAETVIVSRVIPANSFIAGKTLPVYASALFNMVANQNSTSTARVRFGPISLLGTVVASITVANGNPLALAGYMLKADRDTGVEAISQKFAEIRPS